MKKAVPSNPLPIHVKHNNKTSQVISNKDKLQVNIVLHVHRCAWVDVWRQGGRGTTHDVLSSYLLLSSIFGCFSVIFMYNCTFNKLKVMMIGDLNIYHHSSARLGGEANLPSHWLVSNSMKLQNSTHIRSRTSNVM